MIPTSPGEFRGTQASRRRLFESIFFALGLMLFVGLFLSIDLRAVVASVRRAGPAFLASLGCYLTSQLLNARAWQLVLGGDVPFRRVLAASWAGHAANQLTPGSTAGEFWKASLLKAPGMDLKRIGASVVTTNLLGSVTGLCWVAVSLVYSAVALDLPTDTSRALTISALVAGLVASCVAWLLVRGAAHTAVEWIVRVPGLSRFRPTWMRAALAMDQEFETTSKARPKALRRSVAMLIGCRAMQVCEVWALITAVLPDASKPFALNLSVFVMAFGQVVAWMLSIVPGQLGIAEAGSAGAFAIMGLPPAIGLAMELLRRGRKVVGISIGLGFAAFTRNRDPPVGSQAGDDESTIEPAAGEPRR